MDFAFFLNSVLLGFGLAMDAFSVSCANGLNDPHMKPQRMSAMAGVYAAFQFLMPMIGWLCVHFVKETFTAFQPFIPWIALALLLWIGGKMLYEGIRNKQEDEPSRVTFAVLMVQGVATSIDALSVGFTIADYDAVTALVASTIIAVVTLFVCMAGLAIGKKAGTKLSGKASILGGVILIAIGIEIFVKGIL